MYLLLQEVLVRFAGFSRKDNEWLNVKNAVRERSIQLQPNECGTVNTGDAVVCHQVLSPLTVV